MNIELRICNFRIEKRLINLTSARHYCQPEALSNLDKTLEGQLLHQYIFSLIAQSKEITWYHPDLLFTAYVLIYNSGYSLLTLQILYQSGQLWIEPLLHYTLEIWQDGLYLGETTLTRCPDLLLLYEDRPWQIYEFKSKKNYYNSAQLAFTQLPFRLQHRPLEYTLITPNTVQSLDKPLYTSYLALFIKSGVRLFRLNPYTLFHNKSPTTKHHQYGCTKS